MSKIISLCGHWRNMTDYDVEYGEDFEYLIVNMNILGSSYQVRDDRNKSKIFEWLREYFGYRAVFGKSLLTYNEDFFITAIKILQEEINGGEDNETRTDL